MEREPMRREHHRAPQQAIPTTQRFIFATGIECSYLAIQTPQGVVRMDELEKCRKSIGGSIAASARQNGANNLQWI